MCVRGLSLGTLLMMVAVADGGVSVELVPNPAGPFMPGQTVMVDVFLRQTQPGTTDPCTSMTCDPHLLRMVQFDFLVSDAPPLTINLPLTHDLDDLNSANDIDFWLFDSIAACVASPEICGEGHFIDDDSSDGIPPGLAHVSATFGSETELGPNANRQLNLPDDGTTVKVGTLEVTLPDPAPNPDYKLDLVNVAVAEVDPDKAAQVRWGFGLSGGTDPLTTWRASGMNPDLTGGMLTLPVMVGPPVEVDTWTSLGPHGGAGEIGLEMIPTGIGAPVFVEPRLSGLSKIEVGFDGEIDPATAIPANVNVTGCFNDGGAVDLSSTVITVTPAADNLSMTIEFAPPLPGSNPFTPADRPGRYTISLKGVTSMGGTPVTVNAERDAVAMLADADGDLGVGNPDVVGVRFIRDLGVFDPSDMFTVRSDVDNSGGVGNADVVGVRSVRDDPTRNAAAALANPCQ